VVSRLFSVSADSQILGYCHRQVDPKRSPTVVFVHGLEGCADSHYMLGLASKAWKAGFNVIRLNQRNCGGTEHLTPTLYHGGLSRDVRAVVDELASRDGMTAIWVAGYSMGGNLILRMAGENEHGNSSLKGVVAVSPNIDPDACVTALEQPGNRVYHHYFLTSLKARILRKAALFPGKYDLGRLPHIRTLRQFDQAFTAPDGGYSSAEDYYEQTGARHVLERIRVPALIITAQDDPFVPYRMFKDAVVGNPAIQFVAPEHGGHCGFLQRAQPHEDRYWAENRLLEFLVHDAER
jgi:predicted alpha/beta-fold hydrolase